MGTRARVWNPGLHARGASGSRHDPGILLQAEGSQNGTKTSPQRGPAFWGHSLAESLKTITCVTSSLSEVNPMELLVQLCKDVWSVGTCKKKSQTTGNHLMSASPGPMKWITTQWNITLLWTCVWDTLSGAQTATTPFL